MSRKFRQFTTFNKADTSACTDISGRLRVVHGVEKRCNAILKVMRDEWNRDKKEGVFSRKFMGGMITTFIFEQMQKLPGGKTYRYSDITYALRKMEKLGIVKGDGTYDNLHVMWSLVYAPDQVVVHFKNPKAA